MPSTWVINIDNYFAANPQCIIATAHIDTFPTDLPLEPNIREPNRTHFNLSANIWFSHHPTRQILWASFRDSHEGE